MKTDVERTTDPVTATRSTAAITVMDRVRRIKRTVTDAATGTGKRTDRASGRSTVPVAIRLAATYGLIVAATLLVVAGVAYDLTRRQIAGDVDARLESVADSFQSVAFTDVRSPDDLRRRVKRWLGDQVLPPGEVVAFRTADGHVLSTPDRFDLPGFTGGSALLRSGRSQFANLEDGTPVRALAVPIRLDGRRTGTLVVA